MCNAKLSVLVEGKYRSLNDDYYINKLPIHLRKSLNTLISDESFECRERNKIIFIPLISFLNEDEVIDSISSDKYSIIVDEELLILKRESENAFSGRPYKREDVQSWLTEGEQGLAVPPAIKYIINKMPVNDRSDKYTSFINTYSSMAEVLITNYLKKELPNL